MIRVETPTDGVCRVTIDRPNTRNALSPTDLERLGTAIDEATAPVVLLVGRGSAFCAGADLDAVATLTDPAAFAAHGQRVARRIETTDSVVIAGIDGPARGGGVELAAACDLRVATERASIAESGVEIGLFGAWGGTWRLRRELPGAVARDLLLSGRVIDAQTARQIGFVSRIADPSAVARELATRPHDTLRHVAELCRVTDRAASATAEQRAFADCHATHADDLRADD